MVSSLYPGAKKDLNDGSSMAVPIRGVIHCTETRSGVPGYQGGLTAPHLTLVPNFNLKRFDFTQHYRFTDSSRSLRNLAGGVETNTLRTLQIEIVGTCDPDAHARWKGSNHLYMPELPMWAIDGLAEFIEWCDRELEIPITSSVTFNSYPASYGYTNTRLTHAEWKKFTGWCGHQHVPENVHGDPGNIDIAMILNRARLIREEREMPSSEEIVRALLNHKMPNLNPGTDTTETTFGKLVSDIEVTQDRHGSVLGEIKSLLKQNLEVQEEIRDLIQGIVSTSPPA